MNRSEIRLKFRIMLLLLISLGILAGCIKEDVTDCVEEDSTGVKIHYYYILNPYTTEEREVNLFGSDVHKMNIYIFDENGVFLKDTLINEPEQLEDDNEVFLPLSPGKYTLVSWGGSKTLGSMNDSYEVVDARDPADLSSFLSYLTPGSTTLDKFRLILKDDEPQNITNVKAINMPANLYYGQYLNVEVVPENIRRYESEVIKNTNQIRVKLGGLMNLPSVAQMRQAVRVMGDVPVNIFITARNSRYKYDNVIGEYARLVKYEQPYVILDADTIQVTFTVLRLMEDDRESRVVIENDDLPSGRIVLDIIPAIISASTRVNSQRDLDKNDFYEIEINLNKNLSATVFIDGWQYNIIYPGLQTSSYEK